MIETFFQALHPELTARKRRCKRHLPICGPSAALAFAFWPALMARDESEICVRFAARFAVTHYCDIINLYVRPIDQGLHSGGLQVRLARQNMMEAGFELPGVKHLKRSLEVLKEEGIDAESWNVKRCP